MAFNDLKSFYRSTEWKKFRETYLAKELAEKGEFVCNHCKKVILNKYQLILHHKEYLTEQNVFDYSISLNEGNIEPLCFACHNREHSKGFKSKEVVIVFGSPRAGKSVWTNSVAGEDDLIVDIDRIFEALNNYRSNKLLGTVMDIHRQLLENIKMRKGTWQTAYIITTSIYSAKRIKDIVDPKRIVFIDTSKDICYQRAKEKIQKYEGYKDFLDKYWNEVESNPLLLEELLNN